MTKEMNRTRYLTLIGTIITQFALGSVYTWSLFNAQLSDKLDEPVSQVAFAFGLLSLSLAVASSLAGKLQERFGVRNVTLGAGVLLGIGFSQKMGAPSLLLAFAPLATALVGRIILDIIAARKAPKPKPAMPPSPPKVTTHDSLFGS